MACEQAFLKKLREKGFRLTPQREIILSALHEIEGVATAEKIYARVQTFSIAIDISTVYRTLDLLQEFGIVACIDAGDGQRRYELLGLHGPHIHLVCQRCGAVSGIELAEAEGFADHLRALHGFAADLEHLSISGVCQACRQKEPEIVK
ncbi:MAG: transcriptional repressor [Anaerolineae bacterium]|nr:transcriptional repressor [Anaerolineae bacterium]